MKNFKKLLAIVLSIVLLLPANLAIATSETSNEASNELALKDVTKEKLSSFEKGNVDLSKFVKESVEDDKEKSTTKYRVIVETDIEPAITYDDPSSKGLSTRSISQAEAVNTRNEEVLSNIQDKGLDIEAINTFDTAFSGFSTEVNKEELNSLLKVEGVENVYVAEEYKLIEDEPNMESSYDLIKNREVWNNLGYKGQGKVVAVLDTGIDVAHKDMVLREPEKAKLSESDVNSVLAKNPEILGKYMTNKVPFSYNYFDGSYTNKDLGPDASMHGMHVAGTIGANGPTDDPVGKSVTGVAPEAQLLNMKVFGNEALYSTTYSDIYMKAIDDAVKLGADVVNMSLGSVAGTNNPDDSLNKTVTNAVNNGIDFAISSGNSSHTIYGYPNVGKSDYPYAEDPDYGTTGNPGIATDSMSVASYENVAMVAPTIEFTVEGKTEVSSYGYSTTSPVSPVGISGQFVYLETGSQADYDKYFATGAKLEGKIVLVMRGQNFAETQARSEKAGALAHIVFNHKDGGDALVNMATNPGQTMPSLFIGNTAGTELLKAVDKKLTVTDNKTKIANPNYGQMSDFSSMGPTPHLEMKPEISAPGGQIYSTLNDDSYGTMSGTSMAAPHVAGGFALIRQYLDDNAKYNNLNLEQKTRLAKVLMMNSADILKDPKQDIPFAVRKQGAGGMNLKKAMSVPMIAVNPKTGNAKVELGVLSSKKAVFPVKLQNLTDREVTYKADVELIKDYIMPAEGNKYNTLTTDFVKHDFQPFEVVLKPGETKTVEVAVDFSKDDIMDQFVDGWVHFTSDVEVDVNIPFMGFIGNLNDIRVLDTMRFGQGHKQNLPTYYKLKNGAPLPGLFTPKGNTYSDEMAAISPGTIEGSLLFGTGSMFPVHNYLRNAAKIDTNILDAKGNLVRMINKETNTTKNYYDNGKSKRKYTFADGNAWDGTARGRKVADGQYYMQFLATPYGATNPQDVRVPIYVDTVAPVIEKARIEGTNLIVEGSDVGTGFNFFSATLSVKGPDGKEVKKVELKDLVYASQKGVKDGNVYTIDISTLLAGLTQDELNNGVISILATDHAMNVAAYELNANYSTDQEIPWVYVLKPDITDMYDAKEQNLKGYIIDKEPVVATYTINGGSEMPLKLKASTGLQVAYGKEGSPLASGWTFEQPLLLEEGYNTVKVIVRSQRDPSKEQQVFREMFVDTIKPQVELVSYDKTASKGDMVNVTLKVNEQLPSFTVKANGDFVYRYDKYETMRGNHAISETVSFQVPVYEDGQYPVELVITDIVGNESTIKFVVNQENTVDKTDLQNKVNQAEALDLSNKTEESVKALKDVIAEAKALLANTEATQDQVNAMVAKLDAALAGLADKAVDKSKLEAKLSDAQALDLSNKTEESAKALKDVIAEAKALLANTEATQDQVNAMVAKLDAALAALEDKASTEVDKTALENKVKEAKALDLTNKTEESIKALKDAISEAEALLANTKATQEEVDYMLTKLNAAIASLKDIEEEPTDPKDPTDPTDPTDPGYPVDPTDPTDPANPSVPGKVVDLSVPGRNVQSVSDLYIREYPSSDANSTGILKKNVTIKAYNEYGAWTRTNVGWVASEFLYEVVKPNNDVLLRDNPNGNKIGVVWSDETILAKPYRDGWSEVYGKGFVATSFLGYAGLKEEVTEQMVYVRETPADFAEETGRYTRVGATVEYRAVNDYWIYIPSLAGYAAAFSLQK